MSLDRLKNSWKYYKQQHDLPPMQADEILALIQATPVGQWSKRQAMLFHTAIFLLLILFCQSG